ncbi:MAG: HAD family phosphatase [Bacteroidales bacterium]|nr:HAD family phosphatase [Bacteroidales bacterium]
MNEIIQNIVFDLGGVIIDVDIDKSINLFYAYGFNNIREELATNSELKFIIENYELGLISEELFLNFMRSKCSKNPTLAQVQNAWNSMIKPIKKEIFNLLVKLKEKYNLYVLSNTNSLHYKVYSKDFIDNLNVNFKEFFNQCFLSFEINLRKPDLKIFQYVIEKAKINSFETLFVDDIDKNIETAKQAGFKTLLIKKDLISELEDYFGVEYRLGTFTEKK